MKPKRFPEWKPKVGEVAYVPGNPANATYLSPLTHSDVDAINRGHRGYAPNTHKPKSKWDKLAKEIKSLSKRPRVYRYTVSIFVYGENQRDVKSVEHEYFNGMTEAQRFMKFKVYLIDNCIVKITDHRSRRKDVRTLAYRYDKQTKSIVIDQELSGDTIDPYMG